MPGLDFFSNTPVHVTEAAPETRPGVYYNARLDPKNYLEGPLSPIASTRLRQMLARPGIVVGFILLDASERYLTTAHRLPLVSAMVSVLDAPLKLDLTACTRGLSLGTHIRLLHTKVMQ